MSNRLIIDNVLVAFETMHHLNQKRTGRVGEMALKLDLSKAFDRIEWGFFGKKLCIKWASIVDGLTS